MTTAIYVRVSSKAQDAASQMPDLKKWAGAMAAGAAACAWYEDRATGTTMDRPGWAGLWKSVQSGAVDQIVVWRLDRLGRTASGLTALFEDLVRRRVNLVSLRDGLDLRTPAGRLMANVLASVAVYETEVRSERQLAGIAAAKERGQIFGRPPGPGKAISVTEDRIALVLDLKRQGQRIAHIARVARMSRTTVYKILDGAAGG
jgi:DNA invertase Pin-like site-specific DNA recombinase